MSRVIYISVLPSTQKQTKYTFNSRGEALAFWEGMKASARGELLIDEVEEKNIDPCNIKRPESSPNTESKSD